MSYLQRIISGKESAQTALNKAQKELQEVLKESK